MHMNFYNSMKIHGLSGKGTIGFAQRVNLLKSDNEYLTYPVKGVLDIIEQGTDLSIIVAVFHELKDDDTLGPPVRVVKPIFNNDI